jgi:hypothetical protein
MLLLSHIEGSLYVSISFMCDMLLQSGTTPSALRFSKILTLETRANLISVLLD